VRCGGDRCGSRGGASVTARAAGRGDTGGNTSATRPPSRARRQGPRQPSRGGMAYDPSRGAATDAATAARMQMGTGVLRPPSCIKAARRCSGTVPLRSRGTVTAPLEWSPLAPAADGWMPNRRARQWASALEEAHGAIRKPAALGVV